MDDRVQWILLTRKNIMPNHNAGGYDLVIPKYPIVVNEFGKQEEFNQVVRPNLMPGGDGSLIVTNFQHMSEKDPVESFRYIPNKNNPTLGKWISNWEGGQNQVAENRFIHINSHNDLGKSFYGILKDGVVVAHQEPEVKRESRSLDKDTGSRNRNRTRSGSPPPPMDRSGKKRGCEGPGCAVMGGKKKTRRHKSRKQKKSKSKKHKKSKSKKSTRKK